ncbi:hypothetical protein V2A60_009318 [Cordyceps javanica]|uniref:X-Pro dipeptidyl-peptidase (S15 family) protein n=1 Tax=Cordyceps javanica TaxID=43265 RepID=A0A545VKG7_9HYPO|nr:X-Pro dipeptidyl-peptidase (S15 family) protein [Cordyceps javanica]TQW02180.1 X-Pro dipeptidyl-peptidase (S15 family) protein [Cordyceps javanica]
MSTPENVSFKSQGLKIAAHLYRPVPGSPDRKGAAVVIAHPWTSIKEQSPANYARVLSQAGFYCLCPDAGYQGESEGEPRGLEDPYQRVEDIKNAVTFLVGHADVSSDRIGALGICAAGGYVPFAAQTDTRIRAVGTSAAVCVGTMARRGFDQDSSSLEALRSQLGAAAASRNSDVGAGAPVPLVDMLPPSLEAAPRDLPESFRDLTSYYKTDRGRNLAANQTHPRGWDLMANFDALRHNDMISPRPLLMITGTKAATRWYSEDGVANAKEPKELYVIEDKTHADLYDRIDEAGKKLVEFYGQYL